MSGAREDFGAPKIAHRFHKVGSKAKGTAKQLELYQYRSGPGTGAGTVVLQGAGHQELIIRPFFLC